MFMVSVATCSHYIVETQILLLLYLLLNCGWNQLSDLHHWIGQGPSNWTKKENSIYVFVFCVLYCKIYVFKDTFVRYNLLKFIEESILKMIWFWNWRLFFIEKDNTLYYLCILLKIADPGPYQHFITQDG